MFGAYGAKRYNFKPFSDGLDPDTKSMFDYEDFDATIPSSEMLLMNHQQMRQI